MAETTRAVEATEYAVAENAAKAFNEYLKGKPYEFAYLQDTLGFNPASANEITYAPVPFVPGGVFDPLGGSRPLVIADNRHSTLAAVKRNALADTAAGRASADLAQKMGPITANPLRGMNPNVAAAAGKIYSRVAGDLNRDVTGQQAAVGRAYFENAMGIKGSADATQAGMAADAVRRNMTDAETSYTNSASTRSAIASGAGMAAGFASDYMKNNK
jgi:hypothetical protein